MDDDSESSDCYSSSEDEELPKRTFIARKPSQKNTIPEELEEPEISPLIQKNLKPTKIVLSLETKSKLKEKEEQKIKEEQEKIKKEQERIKEEQLKNTEQQEQDTVSDSKEDNIEKDTTLDETKEQNKEKDKKDLKPLESKVEDASKDEKAAESSEESELEDDSSPPKPKQKKPSPETSEYDPKNVHYEGDLAIYTDPKSGYQYKWCNDTNQWLPKSDITYGFEDDVHTYTDTEGVKYFWDVDRNAWFPKIDDDFMARYQMSYGFVDNKTKEGEGEENEKEKTVKTVEEEEKKVEKDKGVKRKLEQAPPSWFEMSDQQNTKVYVSNLPTDITEQEFVDLMQKCGLVMRDMQTQKMKVKLYTVPDTDILKGDALCSYIKIESVELALNILDGYLYRGKKIKVERAKFEMKGDYNPSLKPKKKRRKDKDKLKKMQEKLFEWRPEKMRGERSKHERVVIIKNLFEPTLFDREVSLILEYQQDLREECTKCGEVKRVVLYDRHPEGVAQITMKAPEEADEVVKLLNGRWFGQRQLTAEIWNGKTKYKIAETDSEISQRLDNWDKFLETDAAPKTEDNKTEQPIAKPAIKTPE